MSSVIIGARSAVLRSHLESVLWNNSCLQLIGSYSIERALAQAENLRPDVLLLDSNSPPHDALIHLLESAEVDDSSRIVILTDDPEMFLSPEGIRLGFRAILGRDAHPEEILAAIEGSLAGLVVTNPAAIQSALGDSRGVRSDLDNSDDTLTPREIDVLRMVADGLGNKEIAARLAISNHTVKFHLSSLFAKLGASNRAEAVTLGIRLGLIMI
jgi:two-component system, NarL family, response regulator YdfI